MNVKQTHRRYESPLREEQANQTRRHILAVSRRLFAAHGYTSTTVAQIAVEAHVSPQTIYNSVGGKAAIVLALNDVLDDEAQVHDIQRRIASSEDPREILALIARLRRQLMEGAGDIVKVLIAAAGVDEDLARALADGEARSRAGTRRIVERLDALGALRRDHSLDEAADVAYALVHHGLWIRLVDQCRWTPDAFEAWCAATLADALLEQGRNRPSPE